MELRCPILRKHLWGAHECVVNQLFGENKGQMFYDARGHLGIDMATIGEYAYVPVNQKFVNGKRTGEWWRIPRTTREKLGNTHIIAAHDGRLTTNVFVQDERNGWGMILTSEDEAYRTLYWHIESPWSSLQIFTERLSLQFTPRFVRAGSIIAVAGNTGSPKYSTGPHLHFELQKKVEGKWVPIDPMPFFTDNETIYHRWYGADQHAFFYQGKEIAQAEARTLRNKWPNVLV
jgi:hypothetical protein